MFNGQDAPIFWQSMCCLFVQLRCSHLSASAWQQEMVEEGRVVVEVVSLGLILSSDTSCAKLGLHLREPQMRVRRPERWQLKIDGRDCVGCVSFVCDGHGCRSRRGHQYSIVPTIDQDTQYTNNLVTELARVSL